MLPIIRTSEWRFSQKFTYIYATSADYDAPHPHTQDFFATVQNEVHFAIDGQTAAKLIAARVGSDQREATHYKSATMPKIDAQK